jgi:hypothetical protein
MSSGRHGFGGADRGDLQQLRLTTPKSSWRASRNPLHVLESALMGADIATIPFNVLSKLAAHPLTDKGLQAFLDDWKKAATISRRSERASYRRPAECAASADPFRGRDRDALPRCGLRTSAKAWVEKVISKEKIRDICHNPNTLTMFRVAAVPVIVVADVCFRTDSALSAFRAILFSARGHYRLPRRLPGDENGAGCPASVRVMDPVADKLAGLLHLDHAHLPRLDSGLGGMRDHRPRIGRHGTCATSSAEERRWIVSASMAWKVQDRVSDRRA